MDDPKEGYLLIGTTMLILLVFLVALLLLMLIYRRRRIEHARDVKIMKEKYHKEMLETQIEIQRDTMQQIGQEIHDSVGQKLTLASLYTEHLNLQIDKVASATKISSISALINEALKELRELSQYLTNPKEKGPGLEILLQKEAAKLRQAEICAVSVETIGKPFELPLKYNTMILRITQEFLQNSIRHSACNNIYIHILYNNKGFQLALGDDGKGFSPLELPVTSGIGIDNMRKRAGLIGAEFSMDSTPGSGTRLNLFVAAETII